MTTTSPTSTEAQRIATARSLSLLIEQKHRDVEDLRGQLQHALFSINRAGVTYERIAEMTGIRPSTIATEIARYRDEHGMSPLPRGRRKGISPKRKVTAGVA